jgi:hypothetical protein
MSSDHLPTILSLSEHKRESQIALLPSLSYTEAGYHCAIAEDAGLHFLGSDGKAATLAAFHRNNKFEIPSSPVSANGCAG